MRLRPEGYVAALITRQGFRFQYAVLFAPVILQKPLVCMEKVSVIKIYRWELFIHPEWRYIDL